MVNRKRNLFLWSDDIVLLSRTKSGLKKKKKKWLPYLTPVKNNSLTNYNKIKVLVCGSYSQLIQFHFAMNLFWSLIKKPRHSVRGTVGVLLMFSSSHCGWLGNTSFEIFSMPKQYGAPGTQLNICSSAGARSKQLPKENFGSPLRCPCSLPLRKPGVVFSGVNTLICFCNFSRRMMTNFAFVQLFSKPYESVLYDPKVIPTLWALAREKNLKLFGSAERSDIWGRLSSGYVI